MFLLIIFSFKSTIKDKQVINLFPEFTNYRLLYHDYNREQRRNEQFIKNFGKESKDLEVRQERNKQDVGYEVGIRQNH